MVFSHPRDRYLNAYRLAQVETKMGVRARGMDGFDHRTLQDVHDLIAAWYRFSRDDGGQLRLGESPDDYETGIDGMTAAMVKGATAGNLLAEGIQKAIEWAKEWTTEAAKLAAHEARMEAATRALAKAHGVSAEAMEKSV